MQISNPEIHRLNIGEVEIVPQLSEWTIVQRKIKNKSSHFIPCTKSSCNSKYHTKDRCWWINPELRPNIQNTITSKKVQDIVNLEPVSDGMSAIMTTFKALKSYIKSADR